MPDLQTELRRQRLTLEANTTALLKMQAALTLMQGEIHELCVAIYELQHLHKPPALREPSPIDFDEKTPATSSSAEIAATMQRAPVRVRPRKAIL